MRTQHVLTGDPNGNWLVLNNQLPISSLLLNPLPVGSAFFEPCTPRGLRSVPLPSPLNPELPFPADDPDDVRQVLLALPAPFLDSEQAHSSRSPHGFLCRCAADAGSR
jgi:hypothetical protein